MPNIGVRYYPFGLKHKGYNSAVTSTNPAQKRLYNGKEFQDELNLNVYDYGFRQYMPDLGRWMEMDPLLNDLDFKFDPNDIDKDDDDEVAFAMETTLGNGGGIFNTDNLNPYSYGYNDPVRFDDPDGRCPICLIVAVFFLAAEPAMAPTGRASDGKAMGEAKNTKAAILLSVVPIARDLKTLNSLSNSAKSKTVEKAAEKNKEGSKDGPTSGKKFTPNQKKEAVKENAEKNGGQTKCEDCGTKTVPAKKSEKGVSPPKNETQVDHIHPRSKGGNTTKENTQVLCRDCNIKKSDKLPGQ